MTLLLMYFVSGKPQTRLANTSIRYEQMIMLTECRLASFEKCPLRIMQEQFY